MPSLVHGAALPVLRLGPLGPHPTCSQSTFTVASSLGLPTIQGWGHLGHLSLRWPLTQQAAPGDPCPCSHPPVLTAPVRPGWVVLKGDLMIFKSITASGRTLNSRRIEHHGLGRLFWRGKFSSLQSELSSGIFAFLFCVLSVL